MGGIGGKGKGRKRREKHTQRLSEDPLRKGKDRLYTPLPAKPSEEKENKLPRKLRELELAQSIDAASNKHSRKRKRKRHNTSHTPDSSTQTFLLDGTQYANDRTGNMRNTTTVQDKDAADVSDATVTAFRMGWNDAASAEFTSIRSKWGAKPSGSRVRERNRRKQRKQLHRDIHSAPLPAEHVSLHDVATAPPPIATPRGAQSKNSKAVNSTSDTSSNRHTAILQRQLAQAQQQQQTDIANRLAHTRETKARHEMRRKATAFPAATKEEARNTAITAYRELKRKRREPSA